MIQFVCETCASTKARNEIWILGLAAEARGVTAARREVTIMSGWIRDNAVHPLAVHFCSEECKDDYMNQLFAEPDAMRPVEVEETVTRRRARPGRKATARSSSRTTRRKKKAA